MLIQPKVYTVVIAGDDLAALYTTLNSVQQLRYRNHDVACILPDQAKPYRSRLARDFNWVQILHSPWATMDTLVDQALAKASLVQAEATLFLQAGCALNRQFLHHLTEAMRRHGSVDLFFPVTVRPEGQTTVQAVAKYGRWPHQLRALDDIAALPQGQCSYFAGSAMLVRQQSARTTTKDFSDQLTLLYWVDQLISSGHRSMVVQDISVFYDGVLYTDVAEATIVPTIWYKDLERHVGRRGQWYDKMLMWLQFSWRTESSPLARLLEVLAAGRALYRTPPQ